MLLHCSVWEQSQDKGHRGKDQMGWSCFYYPLFSHALLFSNIFLSLVLATVLVSAVFAIKLEGYRGQHDTCVRRVLKVWGIWSFSLWLFINFLDQRSPAEKIIHHSAPHQCPSKSGLGKGVQVWPFLGSMSFSRAKIPESATSNL